MKQDQNIYTDDGQVFSKKKARTHRLNPVIGQGMKIIS